MSTARIVTGKRKFIATSFRKVALIPGLRDRWLTCETWASAINTLTTDDINFTLNAGTLGSSLSREQTFLANAHRYEPGVNITGFFKCDFKHTKFYYVCNAGDCIERPKLTASWYAEVMKNQQIVPVTAAAVNCMDITMEINEDRTKRRKLTIEKLRKQTYFDSTEAEMLFKPTEDETVLDAIDRRIDLWNFSIEYDFLCLITRVDTPRDQKIYRQGYEYKLRSNLACTLRRFTKRRNPWSIHT
jgi:hypothetical protein